MGGRDRADRDMRRGILDIAPDVLAMVAEGAWIAAVYAVVEAASHGPMTLGPLTLALAAGAGLVVARRFAPILGDRWPRTALALVAVAGIVGWLVEPAALGGLVQLDPGAALRAHPGGFLAGLAFFRGFAYAAPVGSEVVLERLLQLGLPGLAIPVLLTGALPEPWRSIGLQEELVATVVFLVAATIGVALERVSAVARSTGFDWRGNRAWLALVALLAIGVVAAAIPASLAIAPVLRLVLAALVAPLLFIGAIAGIAQVRLRQVLGLLLVLGALALITLVATGRVIESESGGRSGLGGVANGESQIVNVAGGGLIVLLIVVGILILARLWMRDAVRLPMGDVAEERTIDRGTEQGVAVRPAARRRTHAWPAPVDAVGAYLALLHDLETRPAVRRSAGESPAEHARRLRAEGLGEQGLDLLAADYELARFAGRRLTAAEEHRAVARWGRLRRMLGTTAGAGRASR